VLTSSTTLDVPGRTRSSSAPWSRTRTSSPHSLASTLRHARCCAEDEPGDAKGAQSHRPELISCQGPVRLWWPHAAIGAAQPPRRRKFPEGRKHQYITYACFRCNKRTQSHVLLITNPCFPDNLVILSHCNIFIPELFFCKDNRCVQV
jgi:hypothetical protein